MVLGGSPGLEASRTHCEAIQTKTNRVAEGKISSTFLEYLSLTARPSKKTSNRSSDYFPGKYSIFLLKLSSEITLIYQFKKLAELDSLTLEDPNAEIRNYEVPLYIPSLRLAVQFQVQCSYECTLGTKILPVDKKRISSNSCLNPHGRSMPRKL